MRVISFAAVLVLAIVVSTGCSQGGLNSTQPPLDTVADTQSRGTQLWGYYSIIIDPATETVEIIPLRTLSMEVNILKFLEAPGPLVYLKVSAMEFNPPEFQCNIGIQHPFAGMLENTGFAVRGIVLTNGSWSSFDDPDIVLSGPDELRLTNADGYIRWMNPSEFPFDGTMFNYIPGALGDPDGDTYASTLNPYKLFADDLDNIHDNLDLDESKAAEFSGTKINWRKYELDFGSSPYMIFQYAIVASWAMPDVNPPDGIEDFPPGTVCSEPWRVEAYELSNGLYFEDDVQGGELAMQVLVRDFENADADTVFLEAPGIFPRQEMSLVDQDGGHVTFELTVADIELASGDPFEMLIAAVALDGEGYDGRLPGRELATYIIHEVEVDDSGPQIPGWPFYDDFENYEYIWTAYGGDWWGKDDGYMDAKGGGECYEDEDGWVNDPGEENLNLSYVSSPPINVPESDKDLIVVINHKVDVDVPGGGSGANFAWDMCFARLDGVQIFPTDGLLYETENHYPWTFDDIFCWTSQYSISESTFNLGTEYNGTTIHVEFVMDTYDYIDNCLPVNFGWMIDDILVDFTE